MGICVVHQLLMSLNDTATSFAEGGQKTSLSSFSCSSLMVFIPSLAPI